MHITQLDIEGFRSLNKVTWKPGALNVVIGPNGSGKSNLLRLLEMISVAGRKHLSDYIQSEGGIDSLVWDGQSSKIKFAFATAPTNYHEPTVAQAMVNQLPAMSYEVIISRLGRRGAYAIDREYLTEPDKSVYYIERTETQAVIDFHNKEAAIHPSEVTEQELLLCDAANPLLTDNKILGFSAYMKTWWIYHAINTSADATIRQAAVTRSETQVAHDGQNLINVLHTLYTTDRDFKTNINSAMQAAFGPDYDELVFIPASTNRIELQIRWKTLKREQSAADLSDGTLRFLFLITVLANPHPAPLIAIDEPETGLHPSMLPIITEYAAEASQRTQIIFTTHSDQFLDAFDETKPTTTVAKWENGQTTLTTLTEEELAYWLKDYTLGRMFRTGELEALA